MPSPNLPKHLNFGARISLPQPQRPDRLQRAIADSAKGCRGERATGIEPAYLAWEASALPLSYARVLHEF
jgi:hypothetical protein